MIPKTVVEFFFFLLLVAPGVGYELLRERRAPKLDQTAFREVSRVALYSFWFSFSSCVIIALLRIPFPTGLFDPAAYVRDDKGYLNSYYRAVGWTVILEVSIAFALVILVDQISAAKLLSKIYAKIYPKIPKAVRKILSTDIRKNGLWFELFQAIPEEKMTLLKIRLSDGSRMSGYFHGCTAYDTFKDAEIAIKKSKTSPMWMLDRQDSIGQQQPYTQDSQKLDDHVIWVRGDDISYIKVKYVDKEPGNKSDPKQQPEPAADPEVSVGNLHAGAVHDRDRQRPTR
jgi:hypothetical protein